jgi:hypothetical protein
MTCLPFGANASRETLIGKLSSLDIAIFETCPFVRRPIQFKCAIAFVIEVNGQLSATERIDISVAKGSAKYLQVKK